MENHCMEVNEKITEARGWISDATDVINEDMFYREKPCHPYDGWLKKMEEAKKILQSILDDEAFKTMLAEEEKQYDIDDDKADGMSY